MYTRICHFFCGCNSQLRAGQSDDDWNLMALRPLGVCFCRTSVVGLRIRTACGAKGVDRCVPMWSWWTDVYQRGPGDRVQENITFCCSFVCFMHPRYGSLLIVRVSSFVAPCLLIVAVSSFVHSAQANFCTESNELACAILESGCSDPLVEAIASLGKGGEFPNNIERDLHTWVSTSLGIELQPYDLWITVRSRQPGFETEQMKISIVPPHEFLAAAYHAGDRVFRDTFIGEGGQRQLAELWSNAMTQPWGQNHPLREWDLHHLIPMQYHCDDAGVFRGSSYRVFSVSSATTTGTSLLTKMCCCILDEDLFVPGVTDAEFVRFLNWSAWQGVRGKFPERGYYNEVFPASTYRAKRAGQDLAGPYTFGFFAWKGDLKAKVQTHKFVRRNYQSNMICERCCASKKPGANIFTDFSEHAPHRFTGLSHAGYMRRPPHELSPWVDHPGWTLDRCLWDMMHCLNVQGVACEFAASSLRVLCQAKAFGPAADLDEQLKNCDHRFRRWCRRNGISWKGVAMPRMTRGFIGLSKSDSKMPPLTSMPCLSSEVKACSVRPLCYFLLEVLNTCDVDFDDKGLMQATAFCLCDLTRIWGGEPLVMSQEAADLAYSRGRAFLLGYGSLASNAALRFHKLFKLRPKLHYVDEAICYMRATRENVGKQTCTLEECFMGKMKKIACKTHRKSQALRSIQRYLLFLRWRWHDLAKLRIGE